MPASADRLEVGPDRPGRLGLGQAPAVGCFAKIVDPGPRESSSAALPNPDPPTAIQALLLYALAFVLLYFLWLPLQRRDLVLGLLASEWGGLLGLVVLFAWFTRRSLAGLLRIVRPKPRCLAGAALVGLSAWAAVAILSEWVSPVPKEVIEQLRRSLIPTNGDRGLLATLALVALTPAICEEALFRGPILRGLRAQTSPAAAAVLTGLLFGVFHLDVSRILPVAMLGILLSLVALASGSILPAMLAHLLNNAALVGLAYFRVDEKVADVGITASALIFVASAFLTVLGLLMTRSGLSSAKL